MENNPLVAVRPKHRARPHQFLAAWVRSPLSIGAILPSSRALARALAAAVDVRRPGAVIELGAGTGVVTHALVAAGIDPEKLLIIEREEQMHDILQTHFQQLNVLRADAMHLDEVLAQAGVTRVNAIVSSLPLVSMPKHIRDVIEQQMIACLGEHGVLIQYTYGPASPIRRHQLRAHGLYGKRMKLVVANIPPAHVWLYQRERRENARN